MEADRRNAGWLRQENDERDETEDNRVIVGHA